MMVMEKGFTFVEIIVSLLLLGIIIAIAGIGIVETFESYLFGNINEQITQDGLMTLSRINKELSLADTIENSSTTSCVKYKVETISTYYRSMEIKGAQVFLDTDSSRDASCPIANGFGELLLDGVDMSSGFRYIQYDGTNSTSPPADSADLGAIEVNIGLGGGQTVWFNTTINPRNTDVPIAPEGSN